MLLLAIFNTIYTWSLLVVRPIHYLEADMAYIPPFPVPKDSCCELLFSRELELEGSYITTAGSFNNLDCVGKD